MEQNQDFLLEIGTEELPPKRIATLVGAIATNLEQCLQKAALAYTQIQTFATSRRLAILISNLAVKQPDQNLELKGPTTTIAFDNLGNPTLAAKKFAETCGIALDQLETREEKKGKVLFCKVTKPGKATTELIPEIIKQSLKNLPIPRQMRWGEGNVVFVRPVHWVVLLFGNQVIPAEILGVKTSNQTYGHRFHHPAAITITEPKQYEQLLETPGKVIAAIEKRKTKIREQITALNKHGTPVIDEELLDEVTDLVEWPVALEGTFNPHFLEIPQEVLITSLKTQQRCFPAVDADGKLLPIFITISNIASKNPQQVIAGNKRVITARLADAEYFYRNDLQFTLDSNVDKLKTAIFQEKLGSIYDKTKRLTKLATYIATKINANVAHTKRAAELAKCDLMTTLVWEFPELQGIMGYYYALQQFEPEPIAIAIKEQYLPRFAKDTLPNTAIGCALALADRLDNLVGLFGINKIPTGEKDPQGLRRAALGIIRIIAENGLNLNLQELLEQAGENYAVILENTNVVTQVLDFIFERLRYWYLEQNGDANIFNAVLARRPTNLYDFINRLQAVAIFRKLPEAITLCAAHKRVNNILQKNHIESKAKFNLKIATDPAEIALAKQLEAIAKTFHTLYNNKEYQNALTKLAELKPAIDEFFVKVMVMVDNEKIRTNRLVLLQELRDLFIAVADLSLLA